jgi:hypothetical protein
VQGGQYIAKFVGVLLLLLLLQELASQALEVAQGQRALEDVVDAIQEHEMTILNALVRWQHVAVWCDEAVVLYEWLDSMHWLWSTHPV